MERMIWTDDFSESLQDRIAIRSIRKDDEDHFFVIYEDDGSYLNYHSYRGWQSYKSDEMPDEEREFYEKSLAEPKLTKAKTSAKEFKKLIQQKFPDCQIYISDNYGHCIKVSITKKDGIFAEEIFSKKGTRQEIFADLGIG